MGLFPNYDLRKAELILPLWGKTSSYHVLYSPRCAHRSNNLTHESLYRDDICAFLGKPSVGFGFFLWCLPELDCNSETISINLHPDMSVSVVHDILFAVLLFFLYIKEDGSGLMFQYDNF
jgi:hypothetical protein